MMLFGIAELFWLEQPAALNLALFLGILGASVLAQVFATSVSLTP